MRLGARRVTVLLAVLLATAVALPRLTNKEGEDQTPEISTTQSTGTNSNDNNVSESSIDESHASEGHTSSLQNNSADESSLNSNVGDVETTDGSNEGSPSVSNEEKNSTEEAPNAPDLKEEEEDNDEEPSNTTKEAQVSSSEIENKTDASDTEAQDSEGEKAANEEEEEELNARVSVDYASKSAGALVIEKSKEFKGTSNLLNGDRDKYAIAPCEEKKFVVISLSEDILVKEIKLANYERFSSTVKDFQVMGSQTMDTWVDLGTYTAKPGNGEQVFELVEPTWARYLNFKFLSHHGLEYYCTYSQIKVHGSTMVQGFHDQWKESEETETESDLILADMAEMVDETQIETVTETSSDFTESQETENMGDQLLKSTTDLSQFQMPIAFDDMLHGIEADKNYRQRHQLKDSTLRNLLKASRIRNGYNVSQAKFINVTKPFLISARGLTSKASITKSIPTISSEIIIAPKMLDTMEISMKVLLASFPGPNTLPNELYQGSLKPKKRTDKEEDETTVNTPSKSVESVTREKVKIEKDVEADFKSAEDVGPKKATIIESQDTAAANMSTNEQQQPSGESEKLDAVIDSNHASNTGLMKMLESLPSSECLSKLDYADFKAKMHASKNAQTVNGPATAAGSMEPIFKKLTDEIRALQTNLSIQDQFTKTSVACYQRVLFDLMLEMEETRNDHAARILRLEERFNYPRRIYQLILWILNILPWLCISLYYMIFSWNIRAFEFWLRTCTWIYRGILKVIIAIWPTAKQALVSTKLGSSIAEKLSPVLNEVDWIMSRLKKSPSSQDELSWSDFTVALVTSLVLYHLVKGYYSRPKWSAKELSSEKTKETKTKPKPIVSSSPGQNIAESPKLSTPTLMGSIKITSPITSLSAPTNSKTFKASAPTDANESEPALVNETFFDTKGLKTPQHAIQEQTFVKQN